MFVNILFIQNFNECVPFFYLSPEKDDFASELDNSVIPGFDLCVQLCFYIFFLPGTKSGILFHKIVQL